MSTKNMRVLARAMMHAERTDARKRYPCATCGKRLESEAAAARCLESRPADDAPYHARERRSEAAIARRARIAAKVSIAVAEEEEEELESFIARLT